MNFKDLAAIYQRIRLWKSYLSDPTVAEQIKSQIKDSLDKLENLLKSCWQDQVISEPASHTIDNLERKLTQLNEEARKASNV